MSDRGSRRREIMRRACVLVLVLGACTARATDKRATTSDSAGAARADSASDAPVAVAVGDRGTLHGISDSIPLARDSITLRVMFEAKDNRSRANVMTLGAIASLGGVTQVPEGVPVRVVELQRVSVSGRVQTAALVELLDGSHPGATFYVSPRWIRR